MILDKNTAKKTAELLLQIKAIKLQPNEPLHGLQVGNLQYIAITEQPYLL